MYKFDKGSKSLLKKQDVSFNNRRSSKKRAFALSEWFAKIANLFGMEKERRKIRIDKNRILNPARCESVEIKNDSIIRFMMRMLKLSIAACLIILIWLGFEQTKNYALKSKTFLISSVNINGCDIIPETYIRKLYLDFCNTKGIPQQSNIFTFSINELHKYIMDRCNAIETIYISKNFDYSIGINITERKPVGMFFDSDNSKMRLIDGKMNVFDIQDSAKQNYLILSKRGENAADKNNRQFVNLVKIANSLNTRIKSAISEIEYFETDDVFMLYLKNGVKTLCHLENYMGRLGRIDIVLSGFKPEEIDYIDLRFKNIYLKNK